MGDPLPGIRGGPAPRGPPGEGRGVFPDGLWVPTPTLPAAPLISGDGAPSDEVRRSRRKPQVLTLRAP